MIEISKVSVPISIFDIVNVYEETHNKGVLETNLSYKFSKAVHSGSHQDITIIDTGTLIPYTYGFNRLTLEVIKSGEIKKIKKVDILTQGTKGRIYYKIVPQFSIDEILAHNSWEDFVKNVVLDGCVKDQIIVDITMSLFIPTPLNLQNYNNHMLLITGTKVGKTEVAYSAGYTPIVTLSTAGLLGSYSRTRGEIQGELSGKGVALIDEIMQKAQSMNNAGFDSGEDFGNNILNYMQQGETKRGIEGQPKCIGSKTMIFTGNSDKGLMKSLEFAIQRLSGRWYPERFGSRFGFLLLANTGDMIEVDNSGANQKNTRDYNIDTIRNCLFYVDTDKLFEIYKKIWCVRDMDFLNWIRKTYPFIDDFLVSKFISGYSRASPDIRLRIMAFKVAIILSMDRILSCIKNKRDLNDDEVRGFLEVRTEKYYEIFKSYVMCSIRKLFDTRLYDTWDMKFNKGMEQKDIAKVLGVSDGTVSNWIDNITKAINKSKELLKSDNSSDTTSK